MHTIYIDLYWLMMLGKTYDEISGWTTPESSQAWSPAERVYHEDIGKLPWILTYFLLLELEVASNK
jgi:hypothetical protein